MLALRPHTHTHFSTFRLYLHLHSHLFFLLPRLNKLSWHAALHASSYFNIAGLGLKQKPKRADCTDSSNIFQLHLPYTTYNINMCCHLMPGSTVCNQIAHLSGMSHCKLENCSEADNAQRCNVAFLPSLCYLLNG